MALLEWVMPLQFAHINKKKNKDIKMRFGIINIFWN